MKKELNFWETIQEAYDFDSLSKYDYPNELHIAIDCSEILNETGEPIGITSSSKIIGSFSNKGKFQLLADILQMFDVSEIDFLILGAVYREHLKEVEENGGNEL